MRAQALMGFLTAGPPNCSKLKKKLVLNTPQHYIIDQFRYIKIQPETVELSTRPMGITTEFVGFIPKSLVLKSIVLGSILIYRNWSIHFAQLT